MFEWRGRGVFAMNRLDLGQDLSLTTAVRVDGRSAFGDDVGPQMYPKAAMGYNVPPSVLPAPISNLKVRGALGMAGKLPPKVRESGHFRPGTRWTPRTNASSRPGSISGS